jgi:phage baseplate assembly protein W
MINRNLTYSDIPFIMTKNPFTNDLNLVKDVYAIKQSVKNIVLTIRGERPFNVRLGGNPKNFLFDILDTMTTLQCKNLIANSIATYEPRVELQEIAIQDRLTNPNKINIIIVYNILELGITDSVFVSLERTR